MLQFATAENLEEATRQLAAEFLVVLCEAREKAPGMMRKLPTFSQSIFQIMLNFLLDIEVRRPDRRDPFQLHVFCPVQNAWSEYFPSQVSQRLIGPEI